MIPELAGGWDFGGVTEFTFATFPLCDGGAEIFFRSNELSSALVLPAEVEAFEDRADDLRGTGIADFGVKDLIAVPPEFGLVFMYDALADEERGLTV